MNLDTLTDARQWRPGYNLALAIFQAVAVCFFLRRDGLNLIPVFLAFVVAYNVIQFFKKLRA